MKLASSGYLSFRNFKIIVLLTIAGLRNSLIYVDLATPGYLG